MAEVESNLRAYLVAQAGVLAVYSTRIYVDRIDPSITTAYPFAIIRTVTESPEYAMDGALPDKTLIQIDTYSTIKSETNTGVAALEVELSAHTGAISSITAGSCFITDIRGDFDPVGQVFRRSMDILISQNG